MHPEDEAMAALEKPEDLERAINEFWAQEREFHGVMDQAALIYLRNYLEDGRLRDKSADTLAAMAYEAAFEFASERRTWIKCGIKSNREGVIELRGEYAKQGLRLDD